MLSGANALKDAVGADDEQGDTGNPSNLRQALHQLDTDPNGTKATKVFEKFNAVATEYNAVAANTTANKDPRFNNVRAAFNALQFDYNKGQTTI
uniref:Uncharacterized protein n=1 Tax=Theileria annulata TaxID=5874 RepID=A0A3B0MLM3_THEAN